MTGPIGATLDTGALIALERRNTEMLLRLELLRRGEGTITVPAVVVLEWWRKGHGQPAILDGMKVEPLSLELAQVAGEALAKVKGATAIDAAVMASAAQRGDRVITSDPRDMNRLHQYFLGVAGVIPV